MKGTGFIPQPVRGYELIINGSKYHDGRYVYSESKWVNGLFDLGEGGDVSCDNWEMVIIPDTVLWRPASEAKPKFTPEGCTIFVNVFGNLIEFNSNDPSHEGEDWAIVTTLDK